MTLAQGPVWGWLLLGSGAGLEGNEASLLAELDWVLILSVLAFGAIITYVLRLRRQRAELLARAKRQGEAHYAKVFRLEQQSAALTVLHNIHHIISRERDETGLIEKVCAELHRADPHCRAWVLLTDLQWNVTAAASSGFAREEDPALQTGPRCVSALSCEGLLTAGALEQVCDLCPLFMAHSKYEKKVFHLRDGRGVFGFSSDTGENPIFEDESLFTALVDDLNFGLQIIGERRHSTQLEEALGTEASPQAQG